MKYDAVFIGGGHNSLAAAALLAKKSWSVAVFEKHSKIGGAVQTDELTLPGFKHDFAAMNLSLFAGSAFHQEHAAELAELGLQFVPAERCFASVFDDGTYLGVCNSVADTVARIARFSVADSERWQSMVKEFDSLAPTLFALLGSPITKRSLLKTSWHAWRTGGVKSIFDVLRLLLSSPRDFLDANFESPQVKAMLAAWGMHLDFPPEQAGGAMFPYLEGMTNQQFGLVIGRGGADTMINALTRMIKANGGDIHTQAEVTEIIQNNGRASGIKLRNGDVIEANKAVIANVAPSALTGSLLKNGSGDPTFDAGTKKFRHAPGSMMIHLALDSLPDWRAGDKLQSYMYVHIAPNLRMMSRAYAEASDGLLPVEPVLVVGQPTSVDASRAPDGKHTLWVQVRVLPADIAGDAKGEIASCDWDDVKQDYAQRALDIIEKHAPGFQSKILASAVYSPLDLERQNVNLVGGDQICGSHHLDQNFVFRPVRGWANYQTPVADLYLVGAATWPGAGVGAGSGTMLAKQLAG